MAGNTLIMKSLNLSMSPTEDEVKKIESLLSGDCQWVSEQSCEAKGSMSVHSERLFIIGQGYFSRHMILMEMCWDYLLME